MDPNDLWGRGKYPLYFIGTSDLPAATSCLVLCREDAMMLMYMLGVAHLLQPLWTPTLHSAAQSPITQRISANYFLSDVSLRPPDMVGSAPTLLMALKWSMGKNAQGTRCVEELLDDCPRTWGWALERNVLSVLSCLQPRVLCKTGLISTEQSLRGLESLAVCCKIRVWTKIHC